MVLERKGRRHHNGLTAGSLLLRSLCQMPFSVGKGGATALWHNSTTALIGWNALDRPYNLNLCRKTPLVLRATVCKAESHYADYSCNSHRAFSHISGGGQTLYEPCHSQAISHNS